MPYLSKLEVTGQVLVEVPSLRAIIRLGTMGEIKFFSIRIGYSCVKGIGNGVNCLGSLLAGLLLLA